MRNRSRHLRIQNRIPLFEALVACCIIVSSILLFSFQQVSELVTAQLQVEHDVYSSHHAQRQIETYHQADQLPFAPGPAPIEPPIPDEAESEDCYDDEISQLCAIISLQMKETLDSKTRLFALKPTLDNLPSVSLFILYHCWKSFLPA